MGSFISSQTQWWQLRPMLALACAISIGIALADTTALGFVRGLLLGAIALAGLVSVMKYRQHRLTIYTLACIAAFFWHDYRLSKTRDHPWRSWLIDQKSAVWAEVEGEVVQALNRGLPGFESGEALIKVHKITAAQREAPVASPAYFELRTESPAPLKPGRYVMTGWLSVASLPDNPGQFDRRDYQQRLGLVGDFRLSHILNANPKSWDLNAWLIQNSEACRQWITNVLARHLPQDSPEFIILLAMALGATDTATPEMQIPFRLSGTLHIFAVSGLHVAIIGVIFWGLLKSIGVSRGSKFLLIIPLVFAYAFLTGLRPSALRAALMTSVFLMGPCFNRRGDLMNSLGTAAVLLLVLDTQQLFMPGFQLSFGVLAAIGLFNTLITKPLHHWIEPDPFMPRTLLNGIQRSTWWSRKTAAGLFTMSASSWIGSFVLMYYHFHSVTLGGLLANLALVPLSFFVLGGVVLQLLLSWTGPLHHLISSCSYLLAKWTIIMAGFFSNIPGGNFYLSSYHNNNHAPVQLTVLKLSGADAAQHLCMGDQHWLLDCGSERQFPYGLQTYLHQQGINKIDKLILSHADIAHHGATTWLHRYHGLTDVMAPYEKPKSITTNAPNISWQVIHGSSDIKVPNAELPVTARVLFPPQNWSSRKNDDRTLILQFQIGHQRILWMNDSGFMAEKYVMVNHDAESLRSDVIIRNHHTDDFSMLTDFLHVVKPQAIISSNPVFPADQQIPASLRDYCTKHNITLFDQHQTGAVSLRFWEDRMEISTHRGQIDPLVITGQR